LLLEQPGDADDLLDAERGRTRQETGRQGAGVVLRECIADIRRRRRGVVLDFEMQFLGI
jgi:hypothetical protein